MVLQEEIDNKRREIKPDGYSMSIGEWINLYENGEVDIDPRFQRFFRWKDYQKSSLIESILLGIPIPPIFVSQRDDGIWDVVDGLQRLSTIYEFVGVLKEGDKVKDASVLQGTKYLPSLEGKKWDDPNDPDNSLTQAQRLLIKRSKIDVTILLKDSSPFAKFDLFERLNTGGSVATDQEVRNCILVMFNENMLTWMEKLREDEMFQTCISVSDRSIKEQYDMELLLRFLVFRTMPEDEMRKMSDIGVFLRDKMIEIAQDESYDYVEEERAFRKTFEILYNQMGSESFRRYDFKKDKYSGGFLVTAYEVIALGIGFNYEKLAASQIDIRDLTKGIWSNPEYSSSTGAGRDTRRRVPRLIGLGRKMFDI